MSRSMARSFAKAKMACGRRPPPVLLTARESEVLRWVANGKAAWEIAEILDIAKRSVDEHVQTAARRSDQAVKSQPRQITMFDRIERA